MSVNNGQTNVILKPLRVAIFHKDFEPHLGGGGTARHIHGLATVLAQKGAEVIVGAPNPEKIQNPYITRHVSTFSELRQLVQWAEVVHVHGARSKMALYVAFLARLHKKPFFYTPHCWYNPRSPLNAVGKFIWDQIAERYLLSKCESTILLTEYWREYLGSKWLPFDRTAIIPNCVLQSELVIGERIPRSSEAPLTIFSLGRLSPEKRGRDLICALARPDLGKAVLKIAGKGPDLEALKKLAIELQVQDRIEFLGFVTDLEVADHVASSDVFALASEEEGLPTILLEMILAGIPIVCTNIPGNLAITSRVEIKATYDIGDISRLSSLLASPDPISDKSKAATEKYFTWEKVGPLLLASYIRSLRSDEDRGYDLQSLSTSA